MDEGWLEGEIWSQNRRAPSLSSPVVSMVLLESGPPDGAYWTTTDVIKPWVERCLDEFVSDASHASSESGALFSSMPAEALVWCTEVDAPSTYILDFTTLLPEVN